MQVDWARLREQAADVEPGQQGRFLRLLVPLLLAAASLAVCLLLPDSLERSVILPCLVPLPLLAGALDFLLLREHF